MLFVVICGLNNTSEDYFTIPHHYLVLEGTSGAGQLQNNLTLSEVMFILYLTFQDSTKVNAVIQANKKTAIVVQNKKRTFIFEVPLQGVVVPGAEQG